MKHPVEIDGARIRRTLETMVSIDSILPHEEKLAAYVADELRSMGMDVEVFWDEVAPGRPNVTASIGFGSGGPFLVFSGHSDTVGVAEGWETDPFRLTEMDGMLFGLGAINMKAGLACALEAFRAIVESKGTGMGGRLGFAMTVDQEGLSLGARRLLETEFGKCDAMLHAEHFHGDSEKDYLPSTGTGKVLYRIVVKGRTAHAFRPHEGGVNAVTDASKIVAALERLPLGEDPLLGRGTQCVLRIDGGPEEYSIVVPDRCEALVTRLLVPGETKESAVRDLRDLVDTLALESEVDIDTPPPFYEPFANAPAWSVQTPFRKAYRTTIGKDPHFAGHRGVTDANVFVAEGSIPTLVFGPKGGLHHRPGEHVIESSLAPTAQVYAETARIFLAR